MLWSQNWKENVIILKKSSQLALLDVVVLTINSANNEDVVKLPKFTFE